MCNGSKCRLWLGPVHTQTDSGGQVLAPQEVMGTQQVWGQVPGPPGEQPGLVSSHQPTRGQEVGEGSTVSSTPGGAKKTVPTVEL